MEKVLFEAHGSALSINIRYESPNAEDLYSTYTYTLWAANSNAIADEKSGNNFSDDDDNFWLPTPAKKNHERVIDVFSTLKNTRSDKLKVKVVVEICQDGNTIHVEEDEKIINSKSTTFSEIFLELISS